MRIFFLSFLLFFFLSFGVLFSNDIPDESQNCLDAATLFKESFQYQKAAEILSQSGVSDCCFVQHYLGRIYYLAGESKKAFKIFSAQNCRKNWQDYLYLGLILEDLGRIEPSKEAYKNSLKLNQNSIAVFRLAKIYRSQKKYGQAAALFRKLIQLDSSQRLAYYYLGQCLSKLGQFKDAYRYLARSIKFYPHSLIVKNKLNQVRQSLGESFFIKQRELREKERRRKKAGLFAYRKDKESPLVKVGIAAGLDKFSFSAPAGFKIKDANSSYYPGKANLFYTFKKDGSKLFLFDRETGRKKFSFQLPVEILPLPEKQKKYPFYLLDIAYGKEYFWQTIIDRAYRGNFKIIENNDKLTLVNVVSVEEYLYGVLASEIPAWAPRNALEAQAILARSLVLRGKGRHKGEGFDFCADVHCQVYHGFWAETESTRRAVDNTRGRVVFYRGEIPEIFYHANCGGCLSSDVFGEKDYLASGPDSEKEILPQSSFQRQLWYCDYPQSFCRDKKASFRWQRAYDSEDFKIAFGEKIEDLKIVPRLKEDCFRYGQINVILRQKEIFLKNGLAVRNFFDGLRSSSFLVELKNKGLEHPGMLIFWGAGFGHGSGLCQEGAMGMAEAGYDCKQILEHYYPAATIKQVY